MPRLPAKQREAEKISTPLPGGGYAASANDVPPRHAWDVSTHDILRSIDGRFERIYRVIKSHDYSSTLLILGTCFGFAFKLEG